MAFTIDNLVTDGEIEVILEVDSALDVTPEEYKAYLEAGLDESLLKYKDGQEPTRFVMKKQLPLKHATRIESAKVKFSRDGEPSVQLGFIIEEVRVCLKSVKNPPSVPKDKGIVIKLTGDGLVDERQMAQLVASDVVTNLYRAREAALAITDQSALKKS